MNSKILNRRKKTILFAILIFAVLLGVYLSGAFLSADAGCNYAHDNTYG